MLVKLPDAPKLHARYASTDLQRLTVGLGNPNNNITGWYVYDGDDFLASGFQLAGEAEAWADKVAKLVNETSGLKQDAVTFADWQPIKTAPKDRTLLLLWDGKSIHLGYQWADAWRDFTTGYQIIASNWMPLPPPPTT